MQIRSYAPFRLKQTQVRPLPIQVGDPQVASSAYNHQYLCFNHKEQYSLQQPMTSGPIFCSHNFSQNTRTNKVGGIFFFKKGYQLAEQDNL
jgi:hypothetical protein